MNALEERRRLSHVIEAGVRYLREKLGESHFGLWRDYALEGVSDGSTEWLSAFMAMELGPIPEARPMVIEVVLTLLAGARPSGGWGYRSDVPEDCDSTACTLLASSAAGIYLSPSLAPRSIDFILRHQGRDGGFATYLEDAAPTIMMEGRAGWFESEPSVTANSILALRSMRFENWSVEGAERYLQAKRFDGVWKSIWCKGAGYATLQALHALASIGRRPSNEDRSALEAGIIASRRRSGGWSCAPEIEEDVFSTAYALRILLAIGGAQSRAQLLSDAFNGLRRYQTRLGNFVPGVQMLAPGGLNGVDIVVRDRGLMTTACALRAFNDYRDFITDS